MKVKNSKNHVRKHEFNEPVWIVNDNNNNNNNNNNNDNNNIKHKELILL